MIRKETLRFYAICPANTTIFLEKRIRNPFVSDKIIIQFADRCDFKLNVDPLMDDVSVLTEADKAYKSDNTAVETLTGVIGNNETVIIEYAVKHEGDNIIKFKAVNTDSYQHTVSAYMPIVYEKTEE